jgi:RNA polymerase sigma-70 factor (ECF subfamily)
MVRRSVAFEAELLELLPRLRRFCFALTGAAHDADDLMQATVERLLQKPPPDDADLAKWTFRVCRNIWIDEVRARKVRRVEEIDEETVMSGTGGEKEAMEKIALMEVNAAMAKLPDDYRAVLSLVALEGCSYKAAAEVLGIPVGTVMSRLARARRTLADMVELKDATRTHSASVQIQN